MGVRLNRLLGLTVVATSTLLTSVEVFAQTPAIDSFGQLSQPTIPQAADRITKLDRFFFDQSTAGDALFTFGINYGEVRAASVAKRLERFYADLLTQQEEDSPIIRTRDLVNPFDTSVLQLNNQTTSSGVLVPGTPLAPGVFP